MEGCPSNSNPASLSDEALNNKYSIKNLLFYRAIPNYEIPHPTNGHSIFTCKDCGDGFILESSFKDHIHRKSVLIKYQCRYCPRRPLIFYNRCNLLSHIRSHTVRTATINVSDLSVEPLPLSFYKIKKDNLTCVQNAPSITENITQHCNISESQNELQRGNITKFDNIVQSSNTLRSNQDQSSQLESALPSDEKSPADNTPKSAAENQNDFSGVNKSFCTECKEEITSSGILHKDRASHYMRYTNQVYSCPICLFNLPTVCALRIHLRLHIKIPPFFCPECGIHMSGKSVIYPYTHSCEGFNMMRATARSQCPTMKCSLFHPNNFNKHMTENHFKLIYKCSVCVVACFNESTMIKHITTHKHDTCSPQRFYQCDLCPGRLVMLTHMDRHIRSHNQNLVYPCWNCNKPFKHVMDFIHHYTEKHCQYDDMIKNMLFGNLKVQDMLPDRPIRKIYRVVKRCDQCRRNFTYKCQFEDIHILPNSCPYKCVPGAKSSDLKTIRCPLCKVKIDQAWCVIKEHFAIKHKEHRCLDAKISITRLHSNKYLSIDSMHKKNKVLDGAIKKRSTRKFKQKKPKNRKPDVEVVKLNETKCSTQDNHVCGKCQQVCDTKELLEKHIVSHRDPCMAYQCMECGECFVVKTSFSTHLVLKHTITDVDEYINEKKCYNEVAMTAHLADLNVVEEPLHENQCKICREQFECSEDLEKHFRVHGMAFLQKNSLNKTAN